MNKNTQLSLRIIALFVVLMLVSFIPDYLHGFFGDWYCTGYIVNKDTGRLEHCERLGMMHKNGLWHWGYRHWLFILMGITLTIIQVVNIVNWFEKD